jgi:hypothetical protein
VAANASGAVVITGFFRETASFGATTLVSAGGADIFVAGFGPAGNALWAHSAGSTGSDVGLGVCLDPSGRSVVTGSYEGTVQFGTTTLGNAGSRDVFIVSYDGSGTVVWGTRAGGPNSDVGQAVAIDNLGNAIVTGYFLESASFGTFTLADAGGGDVFFARYSPSGSVLWAGRAGGSEYDRGLGVATDGNGSAVVTGAFRGTASFGMTPVTSAGGDDVFLAKIASTGTVLWAWRAGNTGDDRGFGVAADTAGNVFGTGGFGISIRIGTRKLDSEGGWDIFLFKVDGNGS